jgi:excisionase family DNA binding protein
MTAPLALQVPPDLIDEIVKRVAHLLAQREAHVPAYLTPQEAADYLRCRSVQRIYDLTSQGRLPVCKDGSRNLYRRADLDAYLTGEVTA